MVVFAQMPLYVIRQLIDDVIDVNVAIIENADQCIGEKQLTAALRRVAALHPMLRVIPKWWNALTETCETIRDEDGHEGMLTS